MTTHLAGKENTEIDENSFSFCVVHIRGHM